MSGGSLIDYAWSLVALDLVREFPEDFRAALEETFNRSALGGNVVHSTTKATQLIGTSFDL